MHRWGQVGLCDTSINLCLGALMHNNPTGQSTRGNCNQVPTLRNSENAAVLANNLSRCGMLRHIHPAVQPQLCGHSNQAPSNEASNEAATAQASPAEAAPSQIGAGPGSVEPLAAGRALCEQRNADNDIGPLSGCTCKARTAERITDGRTAWYCKVPPYCMVMLCCPDKHNKHD